MKLSFDKNDLLKGINIVGRAVSSGTTMPILKCILLDASTDEIILIGNDMELSIQTAVPGMVREKGRVALDARLFSEIVRKLPDSDVEINTDDRLITNIKCGKAVYNIPGQDAQDYPYPPFIEEENVLSISQLSLKEMISQTLFSININENNKLMTGELFEIRSNTFRIVALDGHRIALRKMELSGEYPDLKAVVPGKTLSEVSKILSDELDQPVTMCFSSNMLLFEFDETKVFTRLIEGEYFHIDNMISSDYQTKIVLNKKDFYECIDRASLLIREGDNKPIVFTVEDGTIELDINTTSGSMNESLEIEKEGMDIRIGFNPKFLTEPLRAIDDEMITLYMINSKAPCFIKNDEGTYLYLILPVNIL